MTIVRNMMLERNYKIVRTVPILTVQILIVLKNVGWNRTSYIIPRKI